MMPRRLRVGALVGAAVLATSCDSQSRLADPAPVRAEIAASMERYQVAARSVIPDSVAAHFTPGGTLFEPGINPIVTRDSIRAFVASFPGVKVEVAMATPDTIEVYGDMALLWGTYFEKLAFPGQPVSEQRGKFVAQWTRQPNGGWLIHRLFRVPLP